ncbi:MAG: hypothetical protein MUF73_09635 [Rhodobacteraceae bacterium]|jgi:hypothetical protein|nr:hypothetical protein [Paracoccaceae bacterium]
MGGMVSAGSDNEHKRRFEERLKRIQRGGPHTTGHVYVGEATQGGSGPSVKGAIGRAGGWLVGLMVLPVAALLGGLSMVIGRFGSFHLASGEGQFTVQAVAEFSPHLGGVAGAILLGSFVCLVLRWSFRLQAPVQGLAMVLGFGAVLLSEPMLVERAPALVAALMSEGYVLDQLYPAMPATPAGLPPTPASM